MSRLTKEQIVEVFGELVESGPIDALDILDVLTSIREIVERSGWGNVQVIIHAGCVEEIITSHRKKPKAERRTYTAV